MSSGTVESKGKQSVLFFSLPEFIRGNSVDFPEGSEKGGI
jgi:hypothetical protein